MKRIRLLFPAFVLALGLALLPAAALAATPYSETVQGVETGFPTACQVNGVPGSLSQFAGTATGTLNGIAQIAVCHTALNPGATILGGSFSISSTQATVGGGFAYGGTVTFLGMQTYFGYCVEHYAVSGALTPNGSFAGGLTHYGYLIGGSCVPFFATISGKASFTA